MTAELVTIRSPRFVFPALSQHDDPRPVGRGVVQVRCRLQQLNKTVDVVFIIAEPSAVLVFDEHFELDADRLQTQQGNRRYQTPPLTSAAPWLVSWLAV